MTASGVAALKTWAGTSNTASRPSCRATVKIDCPGCTTSPASADRAVIVPETLALSSVKLNRSCAMSSCAVASSTRACAVCSACFAESKIARVVKPRSIKWFWRSKVFCASTSWPRAAFSAAWAERSAIELVLWIEFRQHLIRLDLVADPALALDDPSADAEGEVDLVFGADVAGETDRFANLALLDGDSADRARLWRLGLGLLIAAGDEQRESRCGDERADAPPRRGSGLHRAKANPLTDNAAVLIGRALEGATIRKAVRSAPLASDALSGDGRRRRRDGLRHRYGRRRGRRPRCPCAGPMAGRPVVAVTGPVVAGAGWLWPGRWLGGRW